ncbi:MAG: type II toxin-antitoxin system RelE family toxin [Candidatus Micrarchaeaceae archaeon]
MIQKHAAKTMDKMPYFMAEKILETAKTLEQFPMMHADIKKLSQDTYRIRRGNYRIVFEVDGDLLYITEIEVRDRISYSRG